MRLQIEVKLLPVHWLLAPGPIQPFSPRDLHMTPQSEEHADVIADSIVLIEPA